ncbi:MAG: hypothetical protein GY729_11180 [Desulfobacteraceae bacterium]|nr:hypothetical protein [Desulfobacteraceae bacterium]
MSWESEGATEVTINDESTKYDATGKTTVYPIAGATHYTLKATGPTGTTEITIPISVEP